MGNLFSSNESKGKSKEPKAPLTISSDTIVPLHRLDDVPINRNVILEYTMRFDDVLDPDKLRLSLEKLLERRDWRKLGARLRLNDDGKLEYHIPESFSEKRPAFIYSHVGHNIEISKHPTGSRLPKATSKPTIFNDPEEFAPLLRRFNAPQKLTDYLYTDAPQLSLHIVSFTDATIVSLSWPHTLLDAMGRKELLDAWIAVLEGRDDDVKPLLGFLQDPLELLGTNPEEPYVLAHRRLAPIQALFFAIAYIWTTLFWSRGEETRMIFVPAAHVKALHQSALAYLAAQTDPDEKVKPFVSEGDVLSAWVTRLALLHLRDSDRMVSIMNAFGLRSILAKDLLPPTHAYVGNAVAAVWAYLSMRDLSARPLGYTAAAVRQSIAEQGTRAQVEARSAIDQAAARRGKAAMYGDPGMVPVMVSNWSKARFFETDFSAAVVEKERTGSGNRANKVGRPSYIQPNGIVNGMPTRNSFPIVGKDAAGNYWLAGTLRKGLWGRVQQELDAEHCFLMRQAQSAPGLGVAASKG
ncbi:hypothetical protein F5Y04DRAFT_234500 [Hypomontagnella monticulosa]|nr:hypothetical protein F5Y04DRAFT_234500 [Hypomontagnella monticulosa]